MSESLGPISSAVILPMEPEVPKSPRAKRRQSSTSDTASKRPRLSSEGSAKSPRILRSSPQATEPLNQESVVEHGGKAKDYNQERRKSSIQEERKRGQRLFGGLLSTLSQTTPNGQQKRRLEIEKRQAEKAKQQKADDEVRRAEKLSNLNKVREVAQVKFDRESMLIRHSNMLATVNFLCTKSEPKLYYKPWELLPPEEERIKNQTAEVKAIIQREVEEFNNRHPIEPGQGESAEVDKANGASEETVGEPQTEPQSVSNDLTDTTNNPLQVPQSGHDTAEDQAMEEHNGEVVVEAEEDTVIY